MTVLQTVLLKSYSVDDMDPAVRPTSWAKLMEAVAAGAIEYDEIPGVTMPCADLAEEAEHDHRPAWHDAVIAALFECTGEIDSEAARQLIRCGQVADEWVARKANQ